MHRPDRPLWPHQRMAVLRPLLDAVSDCLRALRGSRTESRAAGVADAMQAGEPSPPCTQALIPWSRANTGRARVHLPASGRDAGGPGPIPDADRGSQKNDPHQAGRKENAMTVAHHRRHEPRRARDRALIRWYPHMQQGMALRLRSHHPSWPLIGGKAGAP